MSNLQTEKDGVFAVACGALFPDTIQEAIALSASEGNRPIKFEFNGVEVTVCPDSNPEFIQRDWLRAFNHYIAKKVGPYPTVLTNKEEANDVRIKARLAKAKARIETIRARLAKAKATFEAAKAK